MTTNAEPEARRVSMVKPYLEARSPGRPLLTLHWLVGAPLFLAAFVALPRRLDLGPISGLGALTIAEVLLLATGLLVCAYYPRRLLLRALPYGCFVVWASISLFWASPSIPGIQNGLIYLLFGLALLLSGTLTMRNASLMEDLLG